jgi:hypothetical protein
MSEYDVGKVKWIVFIEDDNNLSDPILCQWDGECFMPVETEMMYRSYNEKSADNK